MDRGVPHVTVVPELEVPLIAGEKARFGQAWHGHCSGSVVVKARELSARCRVPKYYLNGRSIAGAPSGGQAPER